jgi:DNA-binding CsgD family transcriptional regulator
VSGDIERTGTRAYHRRVRAGWPLTGRDAELGVLRDTLRTGVGRACVVVAGAAGVGKTRLARELAAGAEGSGLTVRWAAATSASSGVPLGAFAALLPPIDTSSPSDDLTLLRRAVSAIGDDPSESTILVVDDAHLLDDLSATLVHQLALARDVAMVLTVRTGAPAPDAIVSVWKDGLATRVELQALSRLETHDLVEAVLGGPADAASHERLWKLTLGNPLFLREVIHAGLDSGDLFAEDGVWRFSFAGPGPRLVEIVDARLGRLDRELRSVLEVLALGEPLSPILLAQVVPSPPLGELERRGLVAITTAGLRTEVRLAHPVYTEVLRSQTPTTDARTIQGRLADAVQAAGARRREDLLRVAIWRLESRSAPDRELLGRAALEAHALRDEVLTDRLGRTALESGPSFWASLALIFSLNRRSRFEEAAEVAAAVDLATLTDDQRAMFAEARAQNTYQSGHVQGVVDVLLEVESTMTEPTPLAVVQALRAQALADIGRFREALDLGLPILERDDVDERAKVRVVAAVGTIWILSGQGDRALETAMRFVASARELAAEDEESVSGLSEVASMVVWSLITTGQLATATTLLEAARSDPQLRRSVSSAAIDFALGRIALVEGKVRTAIRLLRAAAADPVPFGLKIRERWGWALLAEAHAIADEPAAARAAVERCEAAERYPLDEPDVSRALTWVGAAAGETTSSVERLLTIASVLRDSGQHTFELFALHDAARLGGAARVTDRMDELRTVVDGAWTECLADHAMALVADDGHGVDLASDAMARIGAYLHAAECAFQAAAIHRRRGLLARASASAANGMRYVAKCEGARTPALREAYQPLALTRREVEVATLAARGTASKDIANSLALSVRTIEGHLQQVYAKLGISSRRELVDIFGEERPPGWTS